LILIKEILFSLILIKEFLDQFVVLSYDVGGRVGDVGGGDFCVTGASVVGGQVGGGVGGQACGSAGVSSG